METYLAFALGVATSYWFLLAALVFAVWAEYSDNHITSAFCTLLGIVSAYLLFNLSPLLLAAYIPVGLAWSVWRWRVHCKKMFLLAQDNKLSRRSRNWSERCTTKEATREALVYATDLKNHVDKVVSWIICFPASMVEQAANDLIHVLRIAVTEWFAKVYNSSSRKALEDFDNNAPSS